MKFEKLLAAERQELIMSTVLYVFVNAKMQQIAHQRVSEAQVLMQGMGIELGVARTQQRNQPSATNGHASARSSQNPASTVFQKKKKGECSNTASCLCDRAHSP